MKLDPQRLIWVSIVAYAIGLSSFFYYPAYVAKNTYVSENALLPGAGRVSYSQQHLLRASTRTSHFHRHASNCNSSRDDEWARGCAGWVLNLFESKGLDATLYESQQGVAVVGILRAGKGDGTEGLVLSTLFTLNSNVSYTRANIPDDIGPEAVGGVGLLSSIADFLNGHKWLAKDVIFIVADSSRTISSWLDDYHKGELPLWGGSLQAALHLSIRPWPTKQQLSESKHKQQEDTITIHMDGNNGQLPNLDIVNTLTQFAKVYHLRTSISLPLQPIGSYFDSFLAYFGLPRRKEFVDMGRLLAFMTRQAIGVPSDSNGPHGYFNQYSIDAISIDVDRDISPNYEAGGASVVLPLVVLGTLRSLNNLLEHLHQSFYYYLLYQPTRYVSIGNYMISFGLLLAPALVYILLGLQWLSGAAPLSSSSSSSSSTSTTSSIATPIKAPAATTVVVNAVAAVILHLGGLVFYSVPLLVEINETIFWALLGLVTIFSLVVVRIFSIEPKIFLLFTTAPTIIFIASMSLLNFSFCVFAAILVVPVYIVIANTQPRLNALLKLALVLVSPPAVLYTLGTICKFSDPFQIFATSLNHHISHKTLLYPFLTLLYTPLNLGYFFTLWKTHK